MKLLCIGMHYSIVIIISENGDVMAVSQKWLYCSVVLVKSYTFPDLSKVLPGEVDR